MSHAPWTDLGRIEGNIQRIESRLHVIGTLESKVASLERDVVRLEADARAFEDARRAAVEKSEELARELSSLTDRVRYIEDPNSTDDD